MVVPLSAIKCAAHFACACDITAHCTEFKRIGREDGIGCYNPAYYNVGQSFGINIPCRDSLHRILKKLTNYNLPFFTKFPAVGLLLTLMWGRMPGLPGHNSFSWKGFIYFYHFVIDRLVRDVSQLNQVIFTNNTPITKWGDPNIIVLLISPKSFLICTRRKQSMVCQRDSCKMRQALDPPLDV